MQESIRRIAIFLLLLLEYSDARSNSHAGHAHTQFGKIKALPYKPRIQSPASKLNTARIDDVVEIFKRNVLRLRSNTKLDLVFVIDASYSVQLHNFKDEIRFVARFVSGIPVSLDTTRVAVITFADYAQVWVDQVSAGNIHDHKCSLLGTALPAITYASGSTYTLGGLTKARIILDSARSDSKKVVLLITDGRSNGGDPIRVAQRLRREGVEIFTFGVASGNVQELNNIASNPKEDHVYVLDSFAEFEAVARRALHADAEGGDYLVEDDHHCHKFCSGDSCCHALGKCRCGTTTGIYECVCDAGHFGFGLLPDGCMPCPAGTYKAHPVPGGPESCTPCPDPNMASVNGSSSVDQCVCIEGFEKVGNRCDVIRCPALSAPRDGRFQGLFCDNRYGSRCRVLCDDGYDLVGTARMTCTISGAWEASDGSGFAYPWCQVRYCPVLAPPTHSSFNCTTQDFSYKTVCQFRCAEGFAYVGTSHMYCQEDSTWDATVGTCQEIRCSPPNVPVGGAISPSCVLASGETLPYGHTCTMTCPSGFSLSVLGETTCFQMNRWSVDTTTAKCVENPLLPSNTEAPTLQCPADIVVDASPQLTTTEVDWVVPVPIDNSDQVTLSAIPAVSPPSSFFIGEHVIVYRAVDSGGLGDECNFTITVVDTTPPRIESCQDPFPFVVSGSETVARYATWTEPTFSDNSGTVFVNSSHGFMDMPYGQTKVTYVARDPTGNTRTCVITISVQNNRCPPLDDPKYGHKVCQVDSYGDVGCELVCDSKRYGMAMHEVGSPYYVCGSDGYWSPEQDIPKDCSHQRYSSEVIKGFRGRYTIDSEHNCNDTHALESVRLKLVEYYTVEVPKWCLAATVPMTCTLMSVDVACVDEEIASPTTPPPNYYDPYAGGYDDYAEYEPPADRKKRHARSSERKPRTRVRRQSGSEPIPPDAYDYYDDTNGGLAGPPGPEPTPIDIRQYMDLPDHMVLDMNPETSNLAHYLEVTVTIQGEIELINDENVEESRQLHGQMSEFFGQMDKSATFSAPVGPIPYMNTSQTINIVYEDNTYAHSPDPELQCPLGAVLRESATCVNCPIGAYYDVSTLECESCLKGYYQDDEAQLSCKPCPSDTSTTKIHARSLEECKSLCVPGTYSHDGLETCVACPRNTYSDEYGATECVVCPPEMGTTVAGASSYLQCGSLCQAGEASWTGIAPCYPCPLHTFQPSSGQTFCHECPFNTTTGAKGSASVSDCIGVGIIQDDVLAELRTRPFSTCFMDPCRNGATCEASSAGYICLCPPGFQGVNCEVNVNECASDPCQNGGSCSDLVNGYSCSCVNGYEGENCETETNECEPEPCMNGATCIDQLASYACQCVHGYTGELCEVNIDDCVSAPCENGGTCHDGVDSFTCTCVSGYTGTVCDIDVDECASDPCINGGACVDRVDGFICECPLGFMGELCQINIDDCVGQTCNNGGSCIDMVNSYRCFCAPTFAGTHCDDELQPDFDLSFNKPNTYHHVHFREGFRNMTEITVAFYMFSNNTESEGTPFSYGVGKGRLADIFTLTNIKALTLYVNGEAVVTDVEELNDGRWYHVVVTWKSEGGVWNIYIDKTKQASGTGLQEGATIPGGGIMVIGQEQDCLGGCFSSSQEFVGWISQFNVYDYAMTDRQVASLFRNCVENKGNVRAWPDALGGIVGQVEVQRPPSFCQSCPRVVPAPNMNVREVDHYKSHITCQTGFNLFMRVGIGSRRMRNGLYVWCGNQGKWRYNGIDRQNPSRLFFCGRKSCPPYAAPPLGRVEATGRLYNDTATFSCNSGFELRGEKQIKCLASQKWSGTTPLCVDIDECAASPCHVMATCTNVAGSFTCQCDRGYTGNGVNCTKIDCGPPPTLTNGRITGNSHFLDDVITHVCDVGHELFGPATRTCQESGMWTGVDPSCDIVHCPELPAVANAQETRGAGTYLSEISYICDPGYERNGSATIVCLETKRWSALPPSCDKVQCPPAPVIENAVVSPNNEIYYFQDRVQVVCNVGYSIKGDEYLRCGEAATWEGQQPVCNPDSCGTPPAIANGRIQGTDYTFQSTVEYICDRGHNLHGTAVTQCLAGPRWSDPPPTCDPVPCENPPAVTNGQVSADSTVFNGAATYTCDTGYNMVGTHLLTCLATGYWGDKTTDTPIAAPTCHPVSCGTPNDVTNGRHMLFGADDFVFGGHVRYVCEEGYFAVGDSVLSCQSNGTWNTSADAFRCDPVPCPAPEQLLNGAVTRKEKIINGAYTYGQTIYFACNAGFNLTGSLDSVCQHTGMWSTAPPICEPVHCGEPPQIQNAATTLNNGPHRPGPHFMSQVTYKCNPGYLLSHSHPGSRVCGSDAKWSGNLPSCERISCLHPPAVQHATSSPYDDFSEMFYGDVTVYTCDPGFQLATGDTGNLECLATGRFSAEPACVATPCGQPPTVAFSDTTGYHPHAQHSFGSEVTYNCERDFTLRGNPTIHCLKTGAWSGSAPSCDPIYCGVPDSVPHGFTMTVNSDDVRHPDVYDSSNYSPRSAAITACDDGYEIRETMAALTAGDEMPELSEKTVLPKLNQSNFSARQQEKLGAALKAMFAKLQAEYDLYDATFTTDAPQPRAAASLVDVTVTSPPAMMVRRCSPVGAWLRAAPVCQPMTCPPPPTLDNGHLATVPGTTPSFQFNGQLSYACDEGYAFGSGHSTANTTCAWQTGNETVGWTALPPCRPVPCPAPSVADNGFFAVNRRQFSDAYVFMDSITYACDPGFDLLGAPEMICESNGDWSHHPPLCNPVECPMNERLVNGYMQYTTITYKSIISFACDVGYELKGATEITCQADRQWSNAVPKCEPIPCGPPPPILHGSVDATSEVYGGEATYLCEPGFTLNGSEIHLCLETGEWFPMDIVMGAHTPTCERVNCYEPLVWEHSTFHVISFPGVQDLHAITDHEFIALSFVYETVIHFDCDPGYETFEPEPIVAVCAADAYWSRDSPYCEPKNCGMPPPPDDNGYFTGDAPTFGNEFLYYCNTGYYTLAPYIKIYCDVNGNWSSGFIPPCLPFECGPPVDPTNGFHVLDGDAYVYPNSVNYTCDLGYDQFGSDVVSCGPTGEWDAGPPDCVPVDCGLLPDIDNGILNLTKTYYPSFASYHCLPGHELVGFGMIQCSWNGMWDAVPPECLPVDCGPVRMPINGFSFGDLTLFKSVSYFLCDDGYILNGSNQTMCTETATWSLPTPDCLPVDCGQPPDVADATAVWDGSSTTFHEVVIYECHNGYEFVDPTVAIIQCKANATWSPAPSCVRVKCPKPNVPEHGQIVSASKKRYRFEDEVRYSCDKGYPMQGSANATCTAERTWSSLPPTCEPVDCGRLPDIVNGAKLNNETLFKSVTSYRCHPGYEAAGGVDLECLHTGSWDREPPVCAPVSCGAPPPLAHGSRIGGSTSDAQLYKSLVGYDCDEGYYLAGPTTAKCTADRSWTFGAVLGPGGATVTNRPVCRKVVCSAPPAVANGYHVIRNHTHGDLVSYACRVGHDLKMLSEGFQCTSGKGDVQGYYKGIPPTCDPVSCGMPATVDNGFFVTQGTTYLKTASYNCHDGHYSTGQTEVVCQANRTWSGFPTCSPHDCAQPPVVANARANVTSTLFGSLLQYHCDVGHELKGSGAAECLASANWSDVSGWSCDPVPCGDPVNVDNSTYAATGSVFGDSVTYTCDRGFLMDPQSSSNAKTLACQASGRWQRVTFTCQPLPCGPAPRITFGNAVLWSSPWSQSGLASLHYRDILEYSCHRGYYMEGKAKLTCTENGTFSSAAPHCPPVLCGTPDNLQNAALTLSGVTFGHNATFTCNPGHVIRWFGALSLDHLAAKQLTVNIRGQRVMDRISPGANILTRGNMELVYHYHECASDETWYPPAPPSGCEPVHCVSPPAVAHSSFAASPQPDVYRYRDAVTYVCDSGYEAAQEELTITCLADKQWSGHPICSPVSCGTPACAALSVCNHTGTTYRQTASASCVVGHEFEPDVTSFEITCQADRQWSSPPLGADVDASTCRRHSCGPPPKVELGGHSLDDLGTSFGATATYACNRGHQFVQGSNPVMTCLADKTWGADAVPACEPKDCGSVVCPLHASCISEGTTFQSVSRVTCDTGYELSYDVFDVAITCLDTGEWSTPPQDLQCAPVTCPKPAQVKNGRITSGNADTTPEFQAQVSYACDQGYYMSGQATLTCTADRSYSHPPPQCNPVSCGEPPNIANGLADFAGITFQHTMKYTCLPGYNMAGDVEWLCSHDKRWIPHLRNVPIPSPPIVARSLFSAPINNEGSGSGDASGHGMTPFDATAFAAPLALRSAMSSSPVSAPRPPTCAPVPCGAAPYLAHGTSVNGSAYFVFKQSVAFICDDGFNLKGASTLYCLEDGTFGPASMPTCERVPCGEPPGLAHLTYTARSVTGGPALYVFEDVATYVCDSGYEHHDLAPVIRLTCDAAGSWSPQSPSACHPVSCGEPPAPPHTIVAGSVFTFGRAVTYACEAGYNLVGFATLTCTASRSWSPGKAPTCAPVSCGRPTKIQHGVYTNQQSTDELDFTFQRSVTYSCHSGYKLSVAVASGERASLTCQADGSWDANAPSCPPVSCGQPAPIANGRVNATALTYGTEAEYRCDVGHEMTGGPVKVCQADRTWSGPLPACTPVSCDRPPHVDHSHYTLTPSLTFGNTVTYQCHDGYVMSGASVLTCTATRTYDLPPPVCIPVSCGQPPGVANGHISSRSGSVTFGHNVTYACDAGYQMRSGASSKTVTCTASRTWSEAAPICDPVSCGAPQSVDHGNVVATAATYLSVASYFCNPGYELGGLGVGENCTTGHVCLVCQADKVWGAGSGGSPTQPPKCTPLSCVEPTGIANGKIVMSSYLFQSTLEYVCDDGYELHPASAARLQCQSNYEWGPQAPPACRRVACPAPAPVLNGRFSLAQPAAQAARPDPSRQYLFEDFVQYSCDGGYRFVNPGRSEAVGSLLCRSNGTWDQAAPACEPVPCGVAPPREHGVLLDAEGAKFHFGQTATYACDVGYEFTGAKELETLSCTATGEWSAASPPPCQAVSCGPDPQVANGVVDAAQGGTSSRRTFQSTVTYRCQLGHYMTGEHTIQCGEDRQWSPHAPQCHPVPCGAPPTVKHGHQAPSAPSLLRSFASFAVTGSGSGDGVLATSSGDAQAEPVPPDVAQTEPVPPDAAQTDPVPLGAAQTEPVPPGAAQTEPVPPDAGQTEPVPPDAAQTEPVPPDAVQARRRRSIGGYVYRDVVHYACDVGYRLRSGSAGFSSCGASGSWSRPYPECEPVPCPALPQIANGRRVGDGFTFGQRVSYECDRGYESSSLDAFVCKADGRFHVDKGLASEVSAPLAVLPVCSRVSCGAGSAVVNGVVKSNNTEYVFEDKLRYGCLPGHNLMGEPLLTCQHNRQFDNSPPTCEPVPCGNPPAIPNSNVHAASTVFRGTATYTCASGYVHQQDTVTCQADGRWSATSLLCERVNCGSPPALHNGYDVANGTKYGDTATYHCHSGYIRSGNNERTCMVDGNWSGADTLCTPVYCGPPSDPTNGHHEAQGNYTFGEAALYGCNTGYELSGESFTVCTASGNWSAPTPTCDRVSCGPSPVATNGAHDQAHVEQRFGDQTVYQCHFGHEYNDSLVLTCGSDGAFDHPPPTCTPKVCGTPPTLPNAQLASGLQQAVAYGGWANYRCVTGHVSGGSAVTVECKGDGNFAKPSGQCVPVECPNLADVVHGSVSARSGRYLDQVAFTCDTGYLLQGASNLTCLALGMWSAPSPICPPVECGPAPNIQHGFVLGEQAIYTFGLTAQYDCDEGYELYDPNTRSKTCQADGNFSPHNVACTPVQCPELAPVFNGGIEYESLLYQANGVITCNEGFELAPGEQSLHFVCQANRTWSIDFNTVSCSPVPCPVLSDVANSNVTQTLLPRDQFNGQSGAAALAYGDSVYYKCRNGYYLEGFAELRCLSNGSWSSNAPTCPPVVCGIAPLVANARATNATHTFGMTARYECHVGHVVASDTMTRVCQADGSFSDHPVSCVPRSCGNAPVVVHGSSSASSGAFADVVTYACQLGYDLVGSNSITCGSDGSWSPQLPTCVPVSCGNIPPIADSVTVSIGTSFGESGTAECAEGYQLSTGEKSIELRCQANRTWSRDLSLITCDPVPCEFIRAVQNGVITVVPPLRSPLPGNARKIRENVGHAGSQTYGTKLRFTCNSGYVLSGADVIECLSNRLWSDSPATCDPVQCVNPPSVPNAQLTTKSHFFGQRANYSCAEGHSLSSAGNFLTCNADGNFSTHEVTCSPVPCTALPSIKNGRAVSISGSRPVFGSVADTVCDNGYSLVGPGEFRCLATGEWSSLEPTCEPNVCGTAPAINNAHSTSDAAVIYSYGDTVTYKCDQGYNLVGSGNNRTCGPNGEFNSSPVRCDPVKCPQVQQIAHASAQGTGLVFGNQLKITCNAGYQFDASGRRERTVTCLHNGQWSEDLKLLSCVGVVCDQLKSFPRGTVDMGLAQAVGSNLIYPSTVVHRCEPGYRLVGLSKRACRSDGTWSGNTPSCEPLDCGPPPQIANGYVAGDKTTVVGSVTSYHCDKGYDLWPPDVAVVECTVAGNWSANAPTCQLITCFVNFVVNHGTLTPDMTVDYGSSVTIKCDEGYEVNGNSTRMCGELGFFDGSAPTCDPVSCGPHPYVPDAVVEPPTDVSYGGQVNITCDLGFDHYDGDLQRTCQANRTWSGKMPSCMPSFSPFGDLIMERSELMPCDPPVIQGNNVKLRHHAEMQSFYDPYVTLEFRCLRGYIPSTNLTITCLSGFWSDEPRCSSKCKHLCLHRGTCSSRGSCNCPRGWSGSRCHRPVCVLPCLNAGYCSAAFTCTCPPGWEGTRCQTPVCSQPCRNGGVCDAPNRCRCPHGFHGDDCSMESFFSFW